jgi:hypothetical protein
MADPVQTCERCGKQVGFTAVGACPCGAYYFPGGQAYPRSAIQKPAEVEASRSQGALTLRWRWTNSGAYVVTGLGALFATLALVFARSVFLAAVFGGPFLYFGLAHWLNSTWITVAGGVVKTRTGPLPIRRSVRLRRAEIAQLYSSLEYHRGPEDESGNSGSTQEYYYVTAILAGPEGRRVKLVKDLPTGELALFLERELERELGIADAPVAEELRR